MSRKNEQLDGVDRKLIRELDANARLSFVDLAKRLGIPAETARYRLNSLTERGVISAFYTVIDAGQLGCVVHKALVKLHNVNEQRVGVILAHLVNHPLVNWVVRMDGMYDLSFTIWTSSTSQVSTFLDDLKGRFHSYITRIALAVNIEAEFLSRDPAQRRTRKAGSPARYTVPQGRYQIDATDLAILRMLSANPRGTATSIAESAGVTSETVAKRIKNLESQKIITGYRLVIDPAAIGEQNFYVLIYLNFVSPEKIKKFVDYCRAHPLLNYIIKSLGEWDYELNIETDDILQFRRLMMELTFEFSDIIRDYQSLPVSAIHKFMIMPPGALPG